MAILLHVGVVVISGEHCSPIHNVLSKHAAIPRKKLQLVSIPRELIGKLSLFSRHMPRPNFRSETWSLATPSAVPFCLVAFEPIGQCKFTMPTFLGIGTMPARLTPTFHQFAKRVARIVDNSSVVTLHHWITHQPLGNIGPHHWYAMV